MKIRFSKDNTFQEDILRVLTLIGIFFAGMNFLNQYCYLSFLALFPFVFLRKKTILDHKVWILLMLSVSWLLFSPDTSKLALSVIIEPLLYPIAYVVGRNFFTKNNSKAQLHVEESRVRKTIVILSMGPYVHYMLNYFRNIGYDGRNSIDIWTKTAVSATNQATMGALMLGVSITFLLVAENFFIKSVSISVLVSILLYNLTLSGRTLLVILISTGVVCLIYICRDALYNLRRMRNVIIIMIFIGVVYYLFTINVGNIQGYLIESNLYNRFVNVDKGELFSSGRLTLKLYYIKNFAMSILGGRKIFLTRYEYAHDIFLDTYDEGGIFALIAISLFIIAVVVELISCLNNKKLQLTTRVMVLALYFSFFMQIMVEPILQGTPWFLMIFCFIHGLVSHLLYISK